MPIKRMKWCKRCDEWEEFFSKNSQVCIKCAEKSNSSRSKKHKGRFHTKPLQQFLSMAGVKKYGDYLKEIGKEPKNI